MAQQGQPGERASIQDLIETAQRLGNLGRDDGPFNRVLITAQDVKRHQGIALNSLNNISILLNNLRGTFDNLNQLREVLQRGLIEQDQFAAQLDGILRGAPGPESINRAIKQLRTLAEQQGIPEETINDNFEMIPERAWREQPLPPPPGAVRGGRRPNTKKRGGYGWSGKKGVEVRSSIRTTRRSNVKKGKKTPSRKKTKKRSSGKK